MKKHSVEKKAQATKNNAVQVLRAHVHEKGFTLLLAALISSIVLALGTSIFGIVQKELILSSIGRDSQFAFYAADTGAECALYWDVKQQIFSDIVPPNELTCDNQTASISVE